MCFGLTILIYLASGSVIRAFMMATFGVIIGCVGQDPTSGTPRFVFGVTDLLDGIGLAPLVMGLFGISEVLLNIEQNLSKKDFLETKIQHLLPNLQDWKDSVKPIVRGTIIGFFLGILPGGGLSFRPLLLMQLRRSVQKTQKSSEKEQSKGWQGLKLRIMLQRVAHLFLFLL